MVDVTYELLKEVIEHKEYLKLILDRYNITNEDYEKIKEIQEVRPTTTSTATTTVATATRIVQPATPVRQQPAAQPAHPVQQAPAAQRTPKDSVKPKKTDLYEL